MAEIAPGYASRPITTAQSDTVLDLCLRAQDYIGLETGAAPDAAYVRGFFEDRPKGFGADQLAAWGLYASGDLVGICGFLQGYDDAQSWYVGLILLDPAVRGQGLGAAWLRHLADTARGAGMRWIKLAVLTQNPRALVFYDRLGFVHHRDAPARPGGDGHDRVVLKWEI